MSSADGNMLTDEKWNLRPDNVLGYSAESSTLLGIKVNPIDAQILTDILLSQLGRVDAGDAQSRIRADGGVCGRPDAMYYTTHLQPTNCMWTVTVFVSAFPSIPGVKPAFRVRNCNYDSGWKPFTTFGDLKSKVSEQVKKIAAAVSVPPYQPSPLADGPPLAIRDAVILAAPSDSAEGVAAKASELAPGGAGCSHIEQSLAQTGEDATPKDSESSITGSMLAAVIPKAHPLYLKCANALVDKKLSASATVATLKAMFEDNQRLSMELQQLKPLARNIGEISSLLASKIVDADEQRARADKLDAELHKLL
jgi:hypothetical protein